MASRRADAVLFGFDFQVNAAIVLMLENIKELSSLRLEGNEEDIVLTLNDDQKILAQAKAVVNSSSDFKNVRANMKKSLTSLSEGSQGVNVRQLIMITNSPNPFKDTKSQSIFLGHAHRKYDTLPPSAKKIVDDYLSEIDNPLDTSLFSVQVLPFETDDDNERYKIVLQVINDFIGELNANLSPGIGKTLHRIWKDDIFKNGSKKDADIVLNKKDLIWPIIVIETDISHCDDSFVDEFDPGLYDEITRRYSDIINSCCERVEFFTQILFDYNAYSFSGKPIDKQKSFVDNCWKNYTEDFTIDNITAEEMEVLIKIILHNVLRRRIAINKIKKGVNL